VGLQPHDQRAKKEGGASGPGLLPLQTLSSPQIPQKSLNSLKPKEIKNLKTWRKGSRRLATLKSA
jgi:hypothetical protein